MKRKTYKVVYRFNPASQWVTLIEKSSIEDADRLINELIEDSHGLDNLSIMKFRDDY